MRLHHGPSLEYPSQVGTSERHSSVSTRQRKPDLSIYPLDMKRARRIPRKMCSTIRRRPLQLLHSYKS